MLCESVDGPGPDDGPGRANAGRTFSRIGATLLMADYYDLLRWGAMPMPTHSASYRRLPVSITLM